MRRLFAMSDIHGQYDAMMKLLAYVEFDREEDHIVFVGDYIDRGKDSAKVLRAVRDLYEAGHDVLMGNHEDNFLAWIAGYLSDEEFFYNGGRATLDSFNEVFTQDEYDDMVQWLTGLPLMAQTDEYLFVHAGINPLMSQQTRNDLLWIREPFLSAKVHDILTTTKGKKVVHGHTPAHLVRDDGARINLDLGAGVQNKLALVDLTNHTVYQYSFADDDVRVLSIISLVQEVQ